MISPEGKNLGLIFSMPRSGSTILSLLLNNHPSVLCPPEPWFLLKVSSLTQPGDIDAIFDDRVATIGTVNFLPDNIFVNAARSFATTVYNNHLENSGKELFVDKTPRYYHILPFIDELFPQAKKIWLKRNPLDIASSYKSTWGIGIDELLGHNKVTGNSFDLAKGLFSLSEYFQQPSPDKLEIYYENLVNSPAETLSSVCKFLNIPFDGKMLKYAQNDDAISQHKDTKLGDKKALNTATVHSNSVGKWQNRLSNDEIQQIVKLLGTDIFSQMGYKDTTTALQSIGITIGSEVEATAFRQRVCRSKINGAGLLQAKLDWMQNSLSWKITEPLRSIGKAINWGKIKENLFKKL